MKLICKKQAPVIVLSGPSGTAKTTLINDLTQYCVNKGLDVYTLSSPARSYFKTRLDDIRQDAEEYLKAQISLATELNAAHFEIDETLKNTVYILDRSLVDTLMYTTLYVNQDKLTDLERNIYSEFKASLMADIIYFQNTYKPITFLTQPLDIKDDDGIRPKNLRAAQAREYKKFKELLNECNIAYYTVNKTDFNTFSKNVYEKLKIHKD